MLKGKSKPKDSYIVIVASHHIAVRYLVAHTISWLARVVVPVLLSAAAQIVRRGGRGTAQAKPARALAQEGGVVRGEPSGAGRHHVQDRVLVMLEVQVGGGAGRSRSAAALAGLLPLGGRRRAAVAAAKVGGGEGGLRRAGQFSADGELVGGAQVDGLVGGLEAGGAPPGDHLLGGGDGGGGGRGDGVAARSHVLDRVSGRGGAAGG